MIKGIRKYIIFVLILCIIFLTGCTYLKLDDSIEIIVSDNKYNSLIFIQNIENTCDSIKFITKAKEKNKVYLIEGKIYDNEIVYRKIIEDRNFELLYAYNETIFVRNEFGIQKIVYKFTSIGTGSNIITDVIVNYTTDGFGELIKPINDLNFIEIPMTDENQKIKNIDNKDIKSLGYYHKQEEWGTTRNKYSKVDIYTYLSDNNLKLYYHSYGYQIIKTISGSIKEDLPEKLINIEVLKNEKEFKLVKNTYYDGQAYIYIIDIDNYIYCYNINENEMLVSNNYFNLIQAKVIDNYLVVLIDNNLYVLNYKLETIDKIELNQNQIILGYTWYIENNKSKILYSAIENNKLTMNIYEIKEETN